MILLANLKNETPTDAIRGLSCCKPLLLKDCWITLLLWLQFLSQNWRFSFALMPTRQIIILANSIKKHARCIAGRDRYSGAWLRPVSGESEGELEPQHMRVDRDLPISVLDVFDVPLIRTMKDPIHPEDWIVDCSKRWRKLEKIKQEDLHAMVEKPLSLWLEKGSPTDRVTAEFLLRQQGHQSLYLIRPSDLRIELIHVFNQFKNKNQKKTRAKFAYGGVQYDLSLTDPVFTNNHCRNFPEVGAPARVIRPQFLQNSLLCVSLTPIFNGNHYKVVATILEPK